MRKHLKKFNNLTELNDYYDDANGYFVGFDGNGKVIYEKLSEDDNDINTVILRNNSNNKDIIVKESDYYKRYIFDKNYLRLNYLTFTGVGSIKIMLMFPNAASTYFSGKYIFYSRNNGITWNKYTMEDTLYIKSGEKIIMKGNFTALGYNGPNEIWHHRFYMTGEIYASGHVNSLLSSYPIISSPEYAFPCLFYGCSALKTAPELPAISLYDFCYSNMFKGCTNLIKAPVLPASYVPYHGYENMFDGCSKLSFVKANFIYARDNSTKDWLQGVSQTGTFIKSKSATWDVKGPDGVPEGWTIEYE